MVVLEPTVLPLAMGQDRCVLGTDVDLEEGH